MNIMWNKYSAKQIREIIRTWPQLPAFVSGVEPVAVQPKAPAVKQSKAPRVAGKRQKHFGADGEIKLVEHRNLYVGFFGGRVVVTKRTRQACAEYLLNVHGVQAAG